MSIAGLHTLVAMCETRGINPFAYLADVIRIIPSAGSTSCCPALGLALASARSPRR